MTNLTKPKSASVFCEGLSVVVFFSQTSFFIIKSCFISHIKWENHFFIVELVRCWKSEFDNTCQNRMENYCHHNREQLSFYEKVHFKTQSNKDVLIIFISQETKNSDLFDKTVLKRTSDAIFNMKKANLDEYIVTRKDIVWERRNFFCLLCFRLD